MIKPKGATSVEEYFAQIEEPRLSHMKALHQLIRKAVPKLKSSIQMGMIGYGTYHYKYASGREGDAPIIALASQKQYISVYVSAAEGGKYVAESYKRQLPKASIGKSCIRFKKLEDIDLEVLAQVVRQGAEVMSKGQGHTA